MKKDRIAYGIVKIIRGPHKGRIAEYDNDTDDDKQAIVYFGSAFYMMEHYFVPHRFLAPITTSDLMDRYRELIMILRREKRVNANKRAEFIGELSLIEGQLAERMLRARLNEGGNKKVFISHSSKDKQVAKWIAVDLSNAGYSPWLDEWKIKVGESIPVKISKGIEESDALIVILSEDAVASRWVENEWQAKYWDEIKDGQIKVLPLLLKKCEIPTLLKTKKYANFAEDYSAGMEDLLTALRDSP